MSGSLAFPSNRKSKDELGEMIKFLEGWASPIGGCLVEFRLYEEDGKYPVLALILNTGVSQIFPEHPSRHEVEEHFKNRDDFKLHYRKPK
jgi:hypothetical protein